MRTQAMSRTSSNASTCGWPPGKASSGRSVVVFDESARGSRAPRRSGERSGRRRRRRPGEPLDRRDELDGRSAGAGSERAGRSSGTSRVARDHIAKRPVLLGGLSGLIERGVVVVRRHDRKVAALVVRAVREAEVRAAVEHVDVHGCPGGEQRVEMRRPPSRRSSCGAGRPTSRTSRPRTRST